nr:hypothetical protein Iba_chr12dCG6740 [Ipomoea batatas]
MLGGRRRGEESKWEEGRKRDGGREGGAEGRGWGGEVRGGVGRNRPERRIKREGGGGEWSRGGKRELTKSRRSWGEGGVRRWVQAAGGGGLLEGDRGKVGREEDRVGRVEGKGSGGREKEQSECRASFREHSQAGAQVNHLLLLGTLDHPLWIVEPNSLIWCNAKAIASWLLIACEKHGVFRSKSFARELNIMACQRTLLEVHEFHSSSGCLLTVEKLDVK